MNASARSRFWALLLCAYAVAACAQTATKEDYKPDVGQAGKDVVWVPTPDALVEKMLDMAKVTSRDIVMDLGSGDGRTVIAAAKRGARAQGVEYNPDMVALSRRNAEKEGVAGRASFVQADLFKTDLTKATVITMFLLTDINIKLRPTILALKPGTRIVSNSFRMGDWEPDETGDVSGCSSWCTAYLWIVPARVEGRWRMDGGGELNLKQTYQALSGTLTQDGRTTQVSRGKVNGEQVSFVAGGVEYRGRVTDKGMEGLAANKAWKASK